MSRPSWDTYFMNIANQVKERSPDFTKVGAVLVSQKDNRIISTGYNAVCTGCEYNIDWKNRDFVKKIVIHAEANCILYSQSKFEDATLYCTRSPCKDCIKLISATKINKIIFETCHSDFQEVKELCESVWKNIELIHCALQ